MTQVLKLKQGDSGTDLNFLAGTTGFQLSGEGWRPTIPAVVYGAEPFPVLESFRLRLKNTNHNNVSANMQSLHEMQVLANNYINDNLWNTPIWLHAKLDAETTERRSLVRDIQIQFGSSWFGSEATGLDFPIVVTVLREPYWEKLTAITLPSETPTAAACVVYDYTAGSGQDIVGDVGARIQNFTVSSPSSQGLRRYWLGVRSADKHPDLVNFINIWEVEDGTPGTDTTLTVDAAASGGNKFVTSESALDWDLDNFREVCRIGITDVTTNEEDQHGTFLEILRAKVTSGTWEVRLSFTMSSASTEIFSEIIEISNTGWAYYELDLHSIPWRNPHAISFDELSETLTPLNVRIYARRTSGSGDLWTDCIVPIPIDEGFIKLEKDLAGSNDYAYFGHGPDGSKFSVNRLGTSGFPTHIIDIRGIYNFILPKGDGRIYMVYTKGPTQADVLSHVSNLNNASVPGKVFQRWLSLAGSEA